MYSLTPIQQKPNPNKAQLFPPVPDPRNRTWLEFIASATHAGKASKAPKILWLCQATRHHSPSLALSLSPGSSLLSVFHLPTPLPSSLRTESVCMPPPHGIYSPAMAVIIHSIQTSNLAAFLKLILPKPPPASLSSVLVTLTFQLTPFISTA